MSIRDYLLPVKPDSLKKFVRRQIKDIFMQTFNQFRLSFSNKVQLITANIFPRTYLIILHFIF